MNLLDNGTAREIGEETTEAEVINLGGAGFVVQGTAGIIRDPALLWQGDRLWVREGFYGEKLVDVTADVAAALRKVLQ